MYVKPILIEGRKNANTKTSFIRTPNKYINQ